MDQALQKNSMDAATVVIAALVVSAIGALFYNVLPLYLGTAQDYRDLDNRAIGFLSSSFFAGFNLVTISAFFWIRRLSWSAIVAVATPLAALSLYAGTLFDSYAALLLATAIAGGAFAALYGVGTTILGDTSNPARWYGVKIAAEAFPGVVLLLVLPSTAIARWGFDGAIIGIIVVLIFLSPFLFWIPAAGSKGDQHLAESQSSLRAPQSPYIWMTLAAVLLFFSGASAMWAFVERIAARGGFDPSSVGVLLSVTLIFAVLGSLLAAAIGGRYGNARPFVAGAALFLLSLLLLNAPDTFTDYAIGACVLTFSIGFLLPVAVTEVAELDHDGRFIVLSVPAIGIGAMTGPGIAGTLAQSGDFLPLLIFGAVMMIISTLLITVAAGRARPAAARESQAEV